MLVSLALKSGRQHFVKLIGIMALVLGSLSLFVAAAACNAGPPPSVPPEEVLKLGFSSAVPQKHEGKVGVPRLPDGLTYKDVIPPGKYDEPDVLVLDPSEKYLYFVGKGEDGPVYRVELANGDVIQLTKGLHRLGGIGFYEPGNMLVVGEEGTGAGPQERKLGFWYPVKPDVPDQPHPEPLRAMGQYRAEGFQVVGRDTIYLVEDLPQGGHVYKYVLDSPPDLGKGTLYVLKKDEGWIKTAFLQAPDTGKEGTAFAQAEGIRMGLDGKLYMVVSAEAENKIVTIEPDTGKITDFVTTRIKGTKGFERPDQIAFNPQGVLFIGEDVDVGDIWAALPDGPDEDTLSDGVFRLATGLPHVQGLQFTKDGSTFYVAQKGLVDSIIAITGFKYR